VKDGDDEANMWPLEYAYYKKVRKKCGVGSYMMYYQFSQQKAVTLAKMDSLLHTVKNLNPDTLTVAGLFTQEVEDSAWAQYGQEIYVDLMKAEPTQTWPEFMKAQAEALKQMAHNLWKIEGEADKRLLIGDNLKKADDRFYGNGKLDIEGYEHGTFVASVIAGKADKEHEPFCGVWTNARIMAVRCSPDGDEYDKDVASSIHYAVDNGAKVINISLGKYLSPDHKMVDDALLYAQKHDVLVIAAAGNNHLNIDTIGYYPQGIDASRKPLDNYVRVGGISMLGKLSRVSNYGGKKVDLYAPGEYISGVYPGDKYDFANGTSVAAPVVTGIAAMIRNCFPKLTAAQVKDVLMKSVHPMEDITISVSGGYVDAFEAVKLAHKLNK
jgi:subtilisin family serine protease